MPYTISSDKGVEFTDKAMRNYVDSIGSHQRFKDVGDMNAIAVVDRSMGLLKKEVRIYQGLHRRRLEFQFAKGDKGSE